MQDTTPPESEPEGLTDALETVPPALIERVKLTRPSMSGLELRPVW